jgi:hypothetical protein
MDPHALEDGIRRHRIYYEVQRETAQYGERRIVVAVQVWLWGTLARNEGVLPQTPGCRAAVSALTAVAAEAIALTDTTPRPDIEPFQWALYSSKHVPDADELRLEINLRAPPGVEGPEQARRERSLEELRRALERLGVAQGLYRAPPPRPAAAPAERWIARPATRAFPARAVSVPA